MTIDEMDDGYIGIGIMSRIMRIVWLYLIEESVLLYYTVIVECSCLLISPCRSSSANRLTSHVRCSLPHMTKAGFLACRLGV